MTDRELHKLNRRELLEMLLAQSKEIDRLRERVQDLEEELSSRDLEIENAGSLAEASLQLSGVFEAAQQAADIYLENIRQRNTEAEIQCHQLVAQTKAKCEQALRRAEERARTLGGRT